MSAHSRPSASDSPEPQAAPCRRDRAHRDRAVPLSAAGTLSSTQSRCSLKFELNVDYAKLLIAYSVTIQRETKVKSYVKISKYHTFVL